MEVLGACEAERREPPRRARARQRVTQSLTDVTGATVLCEHNSVCSALPTREERQEGTSDLAAPGGEMRRGANERGRRVEMHEQSDGH